MKKIFIIFFLLIIIAILGYESYTIYENLPRIPKELVIQQINLSSEIPLSQNNLQFLQNIRFNHNNISYKITMDCSEEKRERMLKAFTILSRETKIISFSEGEDDSDIIISCSDVSIQSDENLFIAGEGGPSRYINNTIYPVILKGRIFLYKLSNCKTEIVEMHELLHVFGFDHSLDKTSIMSPQSDCTQELKVAYINTLSNLYSIPSLAELYFKNIGSINKTGIYLNFEVSVMNKGIIDANLINISVYSDNKKIKSFALGDLKIGEGQKLIITNLKLPSLNPKEITLRIESPNQEYDYENNILRAN